MKRSLIVLLGIATALLLTGCDVFTSTAPGNRWRSVTPGQTEIVVYIAVPTAPADAAFNRAADHGIGVWSSVPNLTLKRTDACQPNTNCIDVFRKSMNGGEVRRQTVPVATQSGVRNYITHVNMWMDSGRWSTASLNNAFCHELGHAIGLDHGRNAGPCKGGKPTSWDLDRANELY
jgi:hypothetical protein